MRAPAQVLTRVYPLPVLDNRQADLLLEKLRAQPGVREVQLAPADRTARLKVDAHRFDERGVLRLIEDLT
jgi:hypothetical protein